MNGVTSLGFQESLENHFSFPKLELAKEPLEWAMGCYKKNAEEILDNFKIAISHKSSRVKAVGAGTITSFLRTPRTPREVYDKVKDRRYLGLVAKTELIKVHIKAYEAVRSFKKFLEFVAKESRLDLDFLYDNPETDTDDYMAILALELLEAKKKLEDLQPAFDKGYEVLDSFLQDCQDKLDELVKEYPDINFEASSPAFSPAAQATNEEVSVFDLETENCENTVVSDDEIANFAINEALDEFFPGA
ncbi:hypothetical protein ABW20_dc0109529 [Dactylellina cionopaga]|nr:hypothetical protein ABW20_dc0109529 [Dactylellina cionopaga]